MWLIFRSSPPKQDARNIVFFYSKNFHLKSCLPTDKNFNIISCNIIHMCLKRNWKNYIAVQSALSIKNIHRQLGFLTALYFFQAVRKPLLLRIVQKNLTSFQYLSGLIQITFLFSLSYSPPSGEFEGAFPLSRYPEASGRDTVGGFRGPG